MDEKSLNTQIQYKMIEKLSAINEDLKKEIDERKKTQEQLEKNNLELEAALQVKSDFLSTMSHEIRTPLNIITGYTQLLSGSINDHVEKKYIQNISFATHSLLNIVDQILQYSKLESEKIELDKEEFSIQNLSNQFTNLFAEKAKRKSLKFESKIDDNIPDYLSGDLKKTHQIIYNIIGNAFKYTDEGKINFIIELEKNNQNTSWVKFTVKDTGIGITKSEINTIFERFRQVQSGITREYGGVGLGLAISKKLVELMNGELFVESEKGIGSTFTFIIPFKIEEPKQISQQNNTNINNEKPLNNINVLLVEDDLFNRELAISVLEKLGCFVKTAKNGQEAISKAQEEYYDVILMDLHMPIINGYDASKKIIENGVSTPILGFSADVLSKTKKKVLEAGMKGTIPKPFNLNELITTIQKVVPSK